MNMGIEMHSLLVRSLSIFTFCWIVSGCSTPERLISNEKLNSEFGNYINSYENDLTKAASKSTARIYDEYVSNDKQTYDILVLSGGGEFGAFGAGFLQGWGNVNSDGMERPIFDSVSGVSTGALIAPFAFVGTEESYSEIVSLYSNPEKDFIVPNSVFSVLGGTEAFYDASVLHRRIANSITPTLVSGLATGDKDSRVLLVGATNIDYGLMRVWDLTDIASNNSFDTAKESIVDKLTASSALPGAFPPVEINDYLYVDGGVSMQVVSGVSDRQWLYNSDARGLEFVEEHNPIKLRIWVIINNKLMLEPEVTQRIWSDIASRSLLAIMRNSTLQTILDIETFSQMINQNKLFDVEMRYVAIPQSFQIPETENMFDKEKMLDLVELGRKMGEAPGSWKTRALLPGAPFEN